MADIKIIVEKHPDGYVAYPLGLKGAAITFHVEAFGADALTAEPPVLEAFVAEATVAG